MSKSLDHASTPPTGRSPTSVDQLCDYFRRSEEPNAALLCQFARELYTRVPRQLMAERTSGDLAALTRGALRFLDRSQDVGVTVEVINPEEEGWGAPVTVIRAALGDRPFIVDTIREYLGGENLPIQQHAYPVVGIERGADGSIIRVTSGECADPRALVHCEIPRIPEADRREAIRQAIERRLWDVVAATDDFHLMLEAVERTSRTVAEFRELYPERREALAEIEDFLAWLTDGNFVFLGYRAYEITQRESAPILRVEPGSGLGILQREEASAWAGGIPLSDVAEELRRRVLGGPMLIITKTNAEATVHRRTRMDYIGIKRLSPAGAVVGEHRFLGLFTSKAYAEHAEEIPILRRKLEGILQASGATPGSHDYKEIITIFNSMPKEDLFQASLEELDREIQIVLNLLFSDEVQVTLRRDPLGRGVSVMVILPRGRFSGEVRHRIQDALASRFRGTILNYHLAMSAGDQARLHFYISSPPDVIEGVEAEEVARDIRQIIRSWDDRLIDLLTDGFGPGEAQRLGALYGPAFREEYRAANLPEVAVQDLEEFERLRAGEESVAITVREPRGRGRAEAFRAVSVLKLYLIEERLVLSDFMPILDNAGLRVIEVSPFVIAGEGLPQLMIYSFAIQGNDARPIDPGRVDVLAEALLAVRAGDTPNDPFNSLVLHAGLRWREVDVIRAYANYAFQAGVVPTRFGTARALVRHTDLAQLIIQLFKTRFDPSSSAQTARESDAELIKLRTAIGGALDRVTTLSDDRAIRRIVNLIVATTRTNYFSHGAANPHSRSGGVPYLALKIRSAEVEELRRSRLLYEIYVYSARMEGIHLRGSAVSRGGIRWSDRLDDFRTEILGLVHTQIVKNAVIVPGGSKGGFVTKYIPTERDRVSREISDQYRTLIRGMLDLTDNIVDGVVVPPNGVVRYDGEDPYLVVAADKGTAHLSDTANAVATEYGFWLGDAFASGGSQGYDHKRFGITARGAWECVKRHFRELGKDIQREPFTVVGIGDMSGDVFGNGMLLSRQIRLIAAFDHRHIFIDPDPDPETSYRERERLFGVERSTWEDYDRQKLSVGGMVVPRSSKEVPLTAEVRTALGIEQTVAALDGEGFVRAVLSAPVELLWNGGIGTYVRREDETNAEVGDPANDPVRITSDQLRCRVIGEGGNLGLTQRARIDYALRGGRLNTDALDNSAGVDMSDHEVNLKILFSWLVVEGLSLEERNGLLEAMGEEVARLVLNNNLQQSLAVSLDEARSREALEDFAALISSFERDRLLERVAEGIPTSDELEERAREGIGLTRPTLCVLLAYSKLHAKSHLLVSEVPDDPAMESYLIDYFPADAVETAGMERLRQHRLRREIIATQFSNELVGLMGAAFLHRVARDTGRTIAAVAAAWHIASTVSGAGEIRSELDRLEASYPSQTVYRWAFGLARVLERTTLWMLSNIAADASLEQIIGDFRSALETLRGEFALVVSGDDRALFEQRLEELRGLGVERSLAERLITLRFLPELLDILRTAQEAATDPLITARTYYLVADSLGISWLQQQLRSPLREEPWEKRLSQSLEADVQRAHRRISRSLLGCRPERKSIEGCLAAFLAEREHEAEAYDRLLEELRSGEPPPLAGTAVGVRALVKLAEG